MACRTSTAASRKSYIGIRAVRSTMIGVLLESYGSRRRLSRCSDRRKLLKFDVAFVGYLMMENNKMILGSIEKIIEELMAAIMQLRDGI